MTVGIVAVVAIAVLLIVGVLVVTNRDTGTTPDSAASGQTAEPEPTAPEPELSPEEQAKADIEAATWTGTPEAGPNRQVGGCVWRLVPIRLRFGTCALSGRLRVVASWMRVDEEQSALVHVNTLLLQSVLEDQRFAGMLDDANWRGLSPLFWATSTTMAGSGSTWTPHSVSARTVRHRAPVADRWQASGPTLDGISLRCSPESARSALLLVGSGTLQESGAG